MAVGYRSSSTSGATDAQGTSRTVPVPSGAAAGDIVIVAIEMWWDSGTSPAVTWPSGFTEIVNISLTGSGPQKLKAAWKRLTGSDSGSYSMSWTGTQWNQAQAICITGALASGDPVDFTNTATSSSGTSVPSTSGSATGLDMLVHLIANENSATKTPPTGHTEVQDANYLETNYKIATGAGTQTASGGTLSASTLSLAALIGIKPDAGSSATDLTVAPAAQAMTSTAVALTQVHLLTVAGAAQAQAADSPALVQNSSLTVQPAAQAQTSSTVALTQVHQLTVDDAAHPQTADMVSLAGTSGLSVNDAAMAQTSTTVALTQTHGLAVVDAAQAQAATAVAFTQVHTLTVSSATQGLSSDTATITAGGSLAVQGATHIQSASAVTLTQLHTLVVADAAQAQAEEIVELAQLHLLQVGSALHLQQADTLPLQAIGDFTSAETTTAKVRPYYTEAVARRVAATAVVRSPAATAHVRSTDEAG